MVSFVTSHAFLVFLFFSSPVVVQACVVLTRDPLAHVYDVCYDWFVWNWVSWSCMSRFPSED